MLAPFFRVTLFGLHCLAAVTTTAQIVINEASSRNAHTIADESGDHPDWIELYNAGNTPIDLAGYSLSDDPTQPSKWIFPSVQIAPQGYLVVFCSGDDHGPLPGMTSVANINDFVPVQGWNSHTLSSPFVWDGSSNLMIQTCALRGEGTGFNSLFKQTNTTFYSSAHVNIHDPSLVCGLPLGDLSNHRPMMRFNGNTVGDQDWINAIVQLPAPYANWYGGARHAFLVRASELNAAGLQPGPITDLAFNVHATSNATLEQLDIHMALTMDTALTTSFRPTNDIIEFHTNFKLGRNGEMAYLYAPGEVLLDSLFVLQVAPNNSNGRQPDGSASDLLFDMPTPGASNNAATPYGAYAIAPSLSVPSGLSQTSITVSVSNPNPQPSEVRYTLDGSTPTTTSTMYTGPITINTSSVLTARAFVPQQVPSIVASASYLIDVHHTTPIIALVTPNENLYGATGIFTNWREDDEIQARVDYFDTEQQLVFSQFTGMEVDGGLGGSRGFPQHSFRLEFDNDVLGDGRVDHTLIPNRPERTRYSRIYLRNGSNQYLKLPHKDAVQVAAMAGGTNSYYAAWAPVTVYINGGYFGLYELREKFDDEYFRTLEQADPSSVDLLSLSAWSGYVLRPTEGEVDPFWQDYGAFQLIDPESASFWEEADTRFDLTWYTDYIIGQQWMGTVDWPVNNIKVHRSDVTNERWRFCTIDLELSMAPNGQSDHLFDALTYTASQTNETPYTQIWERSILNPRFHDHFINRFADVMNSAYLNERVLDIAQDFFDLTRPEMGKHFERWGGPDTTASLATFEANNAAFMSDLELRTPVVRDHIQAFFDLPRQLDVTLDVHPAEAGTIRISTLQPETFPWQGVYFDGVPVYIEAIANEGYFFSHWGANSLLSDTLNALFLDTLSADAVAFDAYFMEDFTTAIDDGSKTKATLQPNPTTGELFVVQANGSKGQVRYQVTDTRGVLVLEGSMNAGQRRSMINASGLHAGLYQLSLFNTDGEREVLRFVKL